MQNVTLVGIDLGKHSFHLHGLLDDAQTRRTQVGNPGDHEACRDRAARSEQCGRVAARHDSRCSSGPRRRDTDQPTCSRSAFKNSPFARTQRAVTRFFIVARGGEA